MKYFLPVFVLIFLSFVVNAQISKSAGQAPAEGNYTWTQSNGATASAGVYNSSGQLIRTLFSGRHYSTGTHSEHWDGLLDDSSVAPAAVYTIKVLTNNVSPVWEGAIIGNTGDSMTGANKLLSYSPPYDICFAGDTAFWALNYAEGTAAHFYTSISQPEAGKTSYGNGGQNNNLSICTDGNVVYMAMLSLGEPKTISFIWGINAVTKLPVAFTNGIVVHTSYGNRYASCIGYENNSTNSAINNIRTQKAGNYFFVVRAGINELTVLNKTTWAVAQTIYITGISYVAITPDDNHIWITHGTTIEKFTINLNGSLTSTGVTHTIVKLVGGIDVSPDNSAIAVCDMDNQVVKGFSTTISNSVLWTLGTPGGYLSDATVTNTKFYWKDLSGYKPTFIQYLSTGGFYLGDGQNCRTLIFDSKRRYNSQIGWTHASYGAGCDVNNPIRAFNGFREYRIDYTKKLAPRNGSWTLTKNWGAQYDNTLYDANANTSGALTLSNGHTYCLMQGKNNNTYLRYIVELVNGGVIRNTGVTVNVFSVLTPDGYVLSTRPSGTGNIINKQAITFDVNNNPVPGTLIQISFAPDNNPPSPKIAKTTNGVVFYNISAANIYNNSDFHIGIINNGSNVWMAKTARGTSRNYSGPFPLDGWFDNGNTVNLGYNGGGGTVITSGNFIFANYHGEFWKQSQTNKWNLYEAATGLFITQFGVVVPDLQAGVSAQAEEEGNVLTGSVVTVGGNTYLYHNGESNGFHRWRINNLNTVNVQTVTFPSKQSSIAPVGIDLMAGLKRYTTLPNGVNGWHRDTSDYFISRSENFSAYIGNRSYDVFEEPDLTIHFRQPNGFHYVTRDLGNNNSSVWKLGGSILLNPSGFTESKYRAGNYIQVLDNAGKIIASFFPYQNNTNTDLRGNDQTLFSFPMNRVFRDGNYYQYFEMSAKGGTLTFTYDNYTATTKTTQEAGANINSPTTLRFYFFTTLAAYPLDKQFTFKNFRFEQGSN